jgi:hypothetical protein
VETANPTLIQIRHGACPRTPRIAAGPARPRRPRGSRRALRRNGKHRELLGQLLAMALGTRGLIAAIYQGFELVITLPADVLKNRHEGLRPAKPALTI